MYGLIVGFLGRALDVFFNRRHLGGEIPLTGPAVVVANHPNGLVDPGLLLRIARRQVRFLAKAPLFKMPILGGVIRALGALPVYRAQDGHATGKNADTFRAVHAALAQGDCICLFPEGKSHDAPVLQPLKTGAARMALGAEAQADFKLGVQVVPVGLIYRDKTRFKSEVATLVGDPIDARRYAEAHAQDDWAAVLSLTGDIGDALEEVTLNIERWADLPLVELAEQIWPRSEASEGMPAVARVREMAGAARLFEAHDPDQLDALRLRVAEFQTRLAEVGLRADQLDNRYSPVSVARFVGRQLLALLVGLPVALVGIVAWAVPYWQVKAAAVLMKPTPDILASVKVLAALVFYPIWLHVLAIGVGLWTTWWAGFLAVPLLPMAGLYAIHFLANRKTAWQATRAFLTLPFSRRARAALRADRAAIVAELDRFYEAWQAEQA